MNNIQQLLDEKYPDVTEISHIQRQAFTDGYLRAYTEMVRQSPEIMQNPFISSVEVVLEESNK